MPPFPDEAGYLWEWWCDIRTMCGDDMSASQIKAWCDLSGVNMEPWELSAINGITRVLHESRQSD